MGLFVYDKTVSQYLRLNNKFTNGIYIEEIIKNGPSYGKGLKEGDIITKIDDKILSTINDLKQYVFTKKPGDIVTLSIDNGRYTKEIQIELDKK